MNDPETPTGAPERGQDSRVEDWYGQSVDRDRRVAEEIVDDESEIDEESTTEFERRAQGQQEQRARHGDEIDPEQGESAYRKDA